MRPNGDNDSVVVREIFDEDGNSMESCPHPQQKLFINLGVELSDCDILRRKEDQE